MPQAQVKQHSCPDALALQDRLDDYLAGFNLWKEQKVCGVELTILDEMFIRWMEASRE
jgi:hypothetical protein